MFLVPGEISFETTDVNINQSEKQLVLKLVRKNGSNGRVVAPWSISPDESNSPYKVYAVNVTLSTFDFITS